MYVFALLTLLHLYLFTAFLLNVFHLHIAVFLLKGNQHIANRVSVRTHALLFVYLFTI